jgi:hypothetical protein
LISVSKCTLVHKNKRLLKSALWLQIKRTSGGCILVAVRCDVIYCPVLNASLPSRKKCPEAGLSHYDGWVLSS